MVGQGKIVKESAEPNPFQKRVRDRLSELERDPFEAARMGEFTDRRFVYDVVTLRKESVRGPNLSKLAKALDWTVGEILGEPFPTADLPSVRAAFPPDVILPRPGHEQAAPRIDGNRDVEVRGISVAGPDSKADFSFNGQVTDYVMRPPGILRRKDVFVIHAVNDSMSPAIEPGEPLFIDGSRAPSPGENVVVELFPEVEGESGPGFIKRLVRRSGSTVVVRQFNPACEIEFDRATVKALLRVIPTRELLGL